MKNSVLLISTLCSCARASYSSKYAKSCQYHDFESGTSSYDKCLNLLRDKHKEEEHERMARMVGEIIADGAFHERKSSYSYNKPPKFIKLDKQTTANLNKL